MFDLDQFVIDCKEAVREPEPTLAVRDVLGRALRDRGSVAATLPVTKAELVPIYDGPDVTVIKTVWAPKMSFPPHDHLTWACIGIFAGCEQNSVYEIVDGRLVESGGFELDEGEVGLLDEDAIHGVVNPRSSQLTAAIHVYGGDFIRLPRSNWIGDPPQQVPADVEQTKAMFEAANRTSPRKSDGAPG